MNQKTSIAGSFYTAGSSSSTEVLLVVEGASCQLTNLAGELLVSYPLADIQISDPLVNLPYRFNFCDGGAFETFDHKAVEGQFKHSSQHPRWWVHEFESHWRWVLMATLLLPLLTVGFLRFGLPVLAKPLSEKIPHSILAQLDEQVLESLDDGWVKPTAATDEQNKHLDDAWRQLGNTAGLTLQQRDGGFMGANAFALPGGTIVVTDQLLQTLDSEFELVAVLAHEAGHVELRHSTRNIIQVLGATAIITTIVGDVSWLAESILVTAPALLQQMSYSRAFETEADVFAQQQLTQLGIPSSCLGASLAKIVAAHERGEQPFETGVTQPEDNSEASNNKHWFDYLSTHPAVEERILLSGGDSCSF